MLLDGLYAASSLLVVGGCVALSGISLRAYRRTGARRLASLAAGFFLVALATAVPTAGMYLEGIPDVYGTFVAHNAVAAAGYLLVVYGLVSLRRWTAG